MKATKLISLLQKILKDHGDLETAFLTEVWASPVQEVSIRVHPSPSIVQEPGLPYILIE